MSFNYNRSGKHDGGESFWTSNSDLFLGLSSIFLILYVVASLRSGADGINSATENKKLKVQIQDLENQLKTYESVKEQYIQNQATKDEKDEYNELMDKLTLLQQEAKNEKDNLTKQAQENAQKERALNKYQQMVRNIINSNSFAKTKVANRNEVIVEKEQVIDEKNVEITDKNNRIASLNADIKSKETLIRNKEAQIYQVNNQLNGKMKELKYIFKKAKLTQKAYAARVRKLKEEAEAKVAMIEQQKRSTLGELENAKLTLRQTENQLNSTKGALVQTQTELEQKGQQISSLNSKLSAAGAETQARMNALKAQFEANRAAERAAFEGALRNQKNLSNAEIARREAAFKAAGEAKSRKLEADLAGLAGQLRSTEGQLAQVKAELAARKNIAKQIKQGFDKMGVKADIDLESGDVLLDFGQSYFESNSANLTTDMRSVLQKAMPVYSKSLFGNEEVAQQISSVEVIGFASPTYKGRVIDPNSNRPEDRDGLKYNMDLSYKRAKSIFNYILDNKEMSFQHRDALVPNLKVSGRSFLDLMKQDRSIASIEDYCKKNDCKKSQRVIIRFSMDKKK
jgi:chromosome segregation ATPase